MSDTDGSRKCKHVREQPTEKYRDAVATAEKETEWEGMTPPLGHAPSKLHL